MRWHFYSYLVASQTSVIKIFHSFIRVRINVSLTLVILSDTRCAAITFALVNTMLRPFELKHEIFSIKTGIIYFSF